MAAATSDLDNSTDEEETIMDQVNESTSASGLMPAKLSRTSKTKPFTNIIHHWFIDDSKDSKCKICSARISRKNATNLANHLKKHKKEYEKYLEEKSSAELVKRPSKDNTKRREMALDSNQSIEDGFRRMNERKNGLKKGSDGYNKAVESIVTAIVGNSLPYSIIEDTFFKDMCTTLSDGRLINLPNRYELSTKIQDKTEKLRTSIKKSLGHAKYVVITIDLWSRPGYSSAMMGITCHYFDRESNQLMRALLACRTIEQPHTGENIFKLYKTIIDEWGINQSQILRIVTDNGSNIVCAFRYVFFKLFLVLYMTAF
jgi:hypothetical protein